MADRIPFPDELRRRTGLRSWPDRGSDYASLIECQWPCGSDGEAFWLAAGPEDAVDETVSLTYEAQDSLWCVRGAGRCDLFARADRAWQFAWEILDALRKYWTAEGTEQQVSYYRWLWPENS